MLFVQFVVSLSLSPYIYIYSCADVTNTVQEKCPCGKQKHYKAGFLEAVKTIKQLGLENYVPVFEFHQYMPKDPKYWIDGIHVNSKGSQVKAELFANFIVKKNLIPESQKK